MPGTTQDWKNIYGLYKSNSYCNFTFYDHTIMPHSKERALRLTSSIPILVPIYARCNGLRQAQISLCFTYTSACSNALNIIITSSNSYSLYSPPPSMHLSDLFCNSPSHLKPVPASSRFHCTGTKIAIIYSVDGLRNLKNLYQVIPCLLHSGENKLMLSNLSL